ncbi:36330_t:CDS:10 [Racocetra persica]|uniref:36330_t:CDS:1 n=1 Tax=Racocetra persica TaxID=160502 RepID=A0ACA9MQZ2_9GLOM|nr:36330_t:CDS:10 [Racocetra persica]
MSATPIKFSGIQTPVFYRLKFWLRTVAAQILSTPQAAAKFRHPSKRLAIDKTIAEITSKQANNSLFAKRPDKQGWLNKPTGGEERLTKSSLIEVMKTNENEKPKIGPEYLTELTAEIAEMGKCPVVAKKSATGAYINETTIIILSVIPSVGLMFFGYGMAKAPRNDIVQIANSNYYALHDKKRRRTAPGKSCLRAQFRLQSLPTMSRKENISDIENIVNALKDILVFGDLENEIPTLSETKLGLAASDQVSHEELKTANLELNVVKEVVEQIERVSQVESEKSIQPSEVSRLTMANPENDVETDAQVSHNQVEQIEFRDKVSRVIPENAKLPNEDRQTFSDVKTKKQVKQKPETIKVSRIVPDEFIDKSNVPRKIVEGQKYVYINGR